MKFMTVDKLKVMIFESRSEMGKKAAEDIENAICSLLKTKSEIRMIFAAAPSQNEVLSSLVASDKIEWNRVTAFHMDEYIGLDKDAPQGFGNFLSSHLFSKVPLKRIEYIDITAADPDKEANRYAALLCEAPIDIVVMGIGENGHIAFNDPPVADFNDPKPVKAVKLDEVCRQQQVNDGCFESIDKVPTHALTLTVPTLMSGSLHFCIVPAKTKTEAVKKTLCGPIGEACPATVLRRADSAILYLDADSASLL